MNEYKIRFCWSLILFSCLADFNILLDIKKDTLKHWFIFLSQQFCNLISKRDKRHLTFTPIVSFWMEKQRENIIVSSRKDITHESIQLIMYEDRLLSEIRASYKLLSFHMKS